MKMELALGIDKTIDISGKTVLRAAGKRYSELRENGTQSCGKTVLNAKINGIMPV